MATQTSAANLSLSDGQLTEPPEGAATFGPVRTAPSSNTDVLTVGGNYASPNDGPAATVEYQINQNGAPTGYWIEAYIGVAWASPGYGGSSCYVYKGKPSDGASTAGPSYTCDLFYYGSSPTPIVKILVGWNKLAEAAAAIDTTGPINLRNGHFYSNNLAHHVDGAATVGTNSSTRSDAFLVYDDQPLEENLAKTWFSYQITDGGVAESLWVMGYSQNFDGNTKYTGESDCQIYDQNPETAPKGPASLKPVAVSAYTCTQTSWRFVNGDRGNYEATFVVAKRNNMVVVTDPAAQRDKINEYCSTTMDNCGLSLSSVKDTFGPGKRASGTSSNPTDSTQTMTFTVSSSESITNGGGFEFGFSIGKEVKAFIKFNYHRDVTETTKTEDSIEVPIPPHSEGWIEAAPPMVHTVGDVVVRVGDRYYYLPNVTADFADATPGHNTWEYVTHIQKLASSSLGGAQSGTSTAGLPTITSPLTPVSTVRGSSSTAGSTVASGLADTGSTVNGAPFLVGLLAILVGAGAIVTRRLRHRNRRARRG